MLPPPLTLLLPLLLTRPVPGVLLLTLTFAVPGVLLLPTPPLTVRLTVPTVPLLLLPFCPPLLLLEEAVRGGAVVVEVEGLALSWVVLGE